MVIGVNEPDLLKIGLRKVKSLHASDQALLLEAVEDALDAHWLFWVSLARVVDVLGGNVAVVAVQHHKRIEDITRAHHAPLLHNTVSVGVRVLVEEREVRVGWSCRPRAVAIGQVQELTGCAAVDIGLGRASIRVLATRIRGASGRGVDVHGGRVSGR